MDKQEPAWVSTDQVGERVGMTGEWVRRQIAAGRLPATVFSTGRRRTYRIRVIDLEDFLERFTGRTDESSRG